MGERCGHALCAERQVGVSSGKQLARLMRGYSKC